MEALQKLIEEWQSLANIVEGIDNDLTARSWFSVGYLHDKQDELEKALSAYDRSISLKSDYAEAYYNRGNTNRKLDDPTSALEDYTQAIRLKPDFV